MNNILNSENRENAIKYLLRNYTEIFELSTEDTVLVQKNLAVMDDAALQRELEILERFFNEEKHIYQKAFHQTIEFQENMDKEDLQVPVF